MTDRSDSGLLGRCATASFALVISACGGGASSSNDAATADSSSDGTPIASRCTVTPTMATCTNHAIQIAGRTVTYELPLGTAPAGGWPIVIFYQGSFIAGSRAFAAAAADAFGQYELTLTVEALLDHGYAVVAPNAQSDGNSYWQTNVPPCSTSWTGCADDMLVTQLLTATEDGTFGPLDPARRYAMGLSSGGFMTSRMAVSYATKFRALAIASGSYATCGTSCTVPTLPADHPPTLFLHGAMDTTVPPSVMTVYRDKLVATGHVVDTILRASAGHEWLPEGKTAIPAWFDAH
ncbi:MAG: uncharacterized protein JWO36_7351 [Myxococcales bacterium]|nr:uncharacterized protein [Myxococcales bacterium]